MEKNCMLVYVTVMYVDLYNDAAGTVLKGLG